MGICMSLGIYFMQMRTAQEMKIPELTQEELLEKIQSGVAFYVYFYSPTCTDCIASEPFLAEAVKNLKINMVKLDLAKNDYARTTFDLPGTPTILYYQNGELVTGISGAMETVGAYEEFFLETGEGQ